MLSIFILSLLCSFGLAIALVEKGDSWPLKKYRIWTQLLMKKVHWRLPQAMFCTVCASFWCSLVIDIVLFLLTGFSYFLWPLSGFACLGVTWTVMQFLNAIDRDISI